MSTTDYVLPSIKSQLGIDSECKAFDAPLTMNINTVFMILKRMGVGPATGFTITPNGNDSWSDFMDDGTTLEAVKSYVYLKVKLIFDPPASGTLVEAIKENIKELEWSLNFEEDAMSDSKEV